MKINIQENSEKIKSEPAEKYKPVSVAFGQSCVNMNTDFGCRNNCIYCFGKNWENRKVIFQPKQMVEQLTLDMLKTELPIGINNSAADPFQPGTIERTFELLDLLRGKVANVMLITKEYISPETVERLNKYVDNNDFRLFIFISYSGLPEEYEQLVDDQRLASLQNLSNFNGYDFNGYVILYARPIIGRLNDFQKIVEASRYCDAVVWSSVRVDNNNAHPLLPPPTGSNLHKSHKRIPDDDYVYICEEMKSCLCPVFQKTSCAISALLKIPDYNCHWSSPELYGCSSCDKKQRKICEEKSQKVPVFDNYTQELINRYKLPKYLYSIPGGFVLEANMVTFSCLRAGILRKLTGYQVFFEYDSQLLTPENLAFKYYELRGEPEGNISV